MVKKTSKSSRSAWILELRTAGRPSCGPSPEFGSARALCKGFRTKGEGGGRLGSKCGLHGRSLRSPKGEPASAKRAKRASASLRGQGLHPRSSGKNSAGQQSGALGQGRTRGRVRPLTLEYPRKGEGEGPPNSQDPWLGCGCGYRQKATGARGRPLPSRVLLAIPG